MIKQSKSKKVISIRTPVVLYDHSTNTQPTVPSRCVSDFKEIIQVEKGRKSYSRVIQATKKKDLVRSSKSFDQSFGEKKCCAQLLMNEQPFIVLKSNKFQRGFTCEKKNSYEMVLNNKISESILKFSSSKRINKKSHDFEYGEDMQIFAIRPLCSPLLPITRKRFLSFYGAKRYQKYGNR
jgi:hypothetical protein